MIHEKPNDTAVLLSSIQAFNEIAADVSYLQVEHDNKMMGN